MTIVPWRQADVSRSGSYYGSRPFVQARFSATPEFEWSWDLEAYISSAWTSIRRDVEIRKTPVFTERGIDGSSITDRVASPGTLTCSLDNGESNSAGLLGYYSPEHANMRANFGRDTLIRLKIWFNGIEYIPWKGYIDDLEPEPGQFKGRSSMLSATDYMQRLASTKLNLLAVQQDQRSDQIIQTVLTAMATAPTTTTLETDTFTLPFALSAEEDERTTPMGVIQKVCQTVLGYFFLKQNDEVVFQTERARAAKTSQVTLTDTMTTMKSSRPTDRMKNRIVGKVHPVRVDDDATTLIYENDNNISVAGGETETFTFRFKDPANKATRISALNVTSTAVANTNFRASRFESGNKDDANGDLTIAITNGGNSTDWEIENTTGHWIHINMVNIFGQGIYYYNPVDVVAETGAADRETNYDFYYLSSQVQARNFLVRLLDRASSETPDIESISFYADANTTLMAAALDLDIGDRVTLSETATGIGGQYTINKVTLVIETDETLRCEWGLEPADTKSYFILDSSLLDGPDVLSPY